MPFVPESPGASLDLLTIAEARVAIGKSATDSSEDATLAPLVTAVSQALDDLCGPIVIRSLTEVRDGGSEAVILNGRVASLTSVTSTSYGTVTTFVDAATSQYGYVVDAEAGLLYAACGWWPVGRRNVTVVYEAGRFADTASVSAKFKQAASYFLNHLYDRGPQSPGGGPFGDSPSDVESAMGLTYAVPNFVKEFLQFELRKSAAA